MQPCVQFSFTNPGINAGVSEKSAMMGALAHDQNSF